MSIISDELALRIGLATRVLPNADAGMLIRILTEIVPGAIDHQSLSSLNIKMLKQAGDGMLADVDKEILSQVVTLLQGKTATDKPALPAIQSYDDGEMPDSIRVACASNKGEMLDGHFGSCARFLVYQVSAAEYRLIDIVEIDESGSEDDKNTYRSSLLKGCQIVFVASIGGPAAAKVVRAGVHPIKKAVTGPAIEAIRSLQEVIGDNAPPWLAKVMGQSPEQRIRFEQAATEL